MAGQPARYTKPEDLTEAVERYFEWVKGEYQDKQVPGEEGKEPTVERIWIRYPEHITITGLALHLGFESRQSIYDYEERGEFSYIIKNARLRVEHAYEKQLYSDKPTGSIFALKNMGWKDTQRTELTGADGKPVVTETHVKIIRDKTSGTTPIGAASESTESTGQSEEI